MSLEQTLTDLNKQIADAKAAGDNETFNKIGNHANELLLAELASRGFERNRVAQAVFSTEVYKDRTEKLYALFMGEYAGNRAEFPLLTACAEQLYTFVVDGIKTAMDMNDALGFPFFGEFKDGRATWEAELDEAHVNIKAVIAKGAKVYKTDIEATQLNEQAARDGYQGTTEPAIIALSYIQRGEVLNFIQLMANIAMGTKNKGMAKDAVELIDQWMLREKDAGKLGKVAGGPYMQLVNVPQAISLGVLHGILGKVANAPNPTATIEA